ncbi:MAG TPA: tetratricopeptide repeat protein [Planctomycetota bacterium]|nr:tetratricopeptide repeat protein [Planctomycetota bacterium]
MLLISHSRFPVLSSPARLGTVLGSLLAALLGIFPAGTLVAQGKIDAALKLARDGQTGGARKAMKEILDDPSLTLDIKNAVDLVKAEVLFKEAQLQTEDSKFQALLEESTDLLRKFLSSGPSQALSHEARRGIDARLYRKADRVGRAARVEENARKRADLEREANDLYSALERHYRERARELRAARGGSSEDELMEVLLDGSRAEIEHSRLPGMDEAARRRILGEAIQRMQDFQFDFAADAMSFEAMAIEGRCHKELGDVRAAEDRFAGALSLRARLVEAGREPAEYHLGILASAYLTLAEILVESGKPREAAKLVDQALGEDRTLEAAPMGWALKLLKAECLFQLDDLAGAHDLAARVRSIDPDGPLGAAAKEKLRVWSQSAAARGSKAMPERLLITAGSLLENEQWVPALDAYRQVIDLSRTDAEKARHQPEAYMGIGQCLSRMGRHAEAASAYEDLFKAFPSHELAPRASFEAARSLGSQFAVSNDPRDEARQEACLATLLEKWPKHAAARSVAFLRAENLERSRQLKEAADLYRTVPDDAEVYESALVSAARCCYMDAGSSGGERNEPDAVKAALAKAEGILQVFFERAASPRFIPRNPDAQKLRDSLTFAATQQLALIYSHEAVARYADSLKLLDTHASTMPEDDPRRARVLALKVRAHLALGEVTEADACLGTMLERFPTSPVIAQTSKSVAARLEDTVEEVSRSGGSPGVVKSRLEKVFKYYMTWFKESASRGARIGASEALSVAGSLVRAARRLNGLAPGTAAFIGLKDGRIEAPRYFAETALLLSTLLEGKLGKLQEEDRLGVMADLARCEAFTASDAEGWERARDRYTAIVSGWNLVDASNRISLGAAPRLATTLISVYIELGCVHFELSSLGQGSHFDEAVTVFQNTLQVTESASEPWWIAKYMTLALLVERGGPSDLKLAEVIVGNLEKSYPDYDEDRFGMRGRILGLKGILARGRG